MNSSLSGFRALIVDYCRRMLASEFRKRTAWFTALNGAERVFAIMQTVLISRALGITEYGVYGLLFGTIGLVASVAGLQMGLAATVFVARYKLDDKPKAAAVISITRNFALLVSAASLLLCAPFSEQLSRSLLGSIQYHREISLAVVFVGVSLVSGVQDGVAQGFEAFNLLAKIRIACSIATLILIYPAAIKFGLVGVISVVLGGALLKYLALSRYIRELRAEFQIPASGAGVSFRTITGDFAFPSMLVSLLGGGVTWFGMLVLSRQDAGFNSVAIANAGIQWRGPILLLASSIAAVAVPVFSRLWIADESSETLKLRQRLVRLNFVGAALVAIVLVVLSKWILQLYGPGFSDGRVGFSLIVVSMVPMVVANVYMSELVGAAKMWRQLLVHVPYVIVMLVGFSIMVPARGEIGYGLTLLIGAFVLLYSAEVSTRRARVHDSAAR